MGITNINTVGVKRNSYYDILPRMSQRELDKYRILEGHSKELRSKLSDVLLNIEKDDVEDDN